MPASLLDGLRDMIARRIITADTAPDDFAWLCQTINDTQEAVDALRDSFDGDSGDEEHDAAHALAVMVSGDDEPDCTCDDESWHGDEHATGCAISIHRAARPIL